MNKELSNKLKADFPYFKSLRYGIECDDGWDALIRETCSKIMEHKPSSDFTFLQIKEKFGGIRMYFTGHACKEIAQIIDDAEEKSYEICEKCGSDAMLRSDGGWARTLCSNCAT